VTPTAAATPAKLGELSLISKRSSRRINSGLRYAEGVSPRNGLTMLTGHLGEPGPVGNVALVDGDVVRNTRFASTHVRGYHAPEVDELLRRVAAELDSGRSPRPLIESATFQLTARPAAIRPVLGAVASRYDIDAVDWFLGKLRLQEGHLPSADMGADPWRDLPVTQVTRSGGSPPGKPGLIELLEIDKILELDRAFSRDCEDAWRDFFRQPGVTLRLGKRVSLGGTRYELCTADGKMIASRTVGNTVLVGMRAFSHRICGRDSWPPGVAEIAARSARDFAGHFSGQTIVGTPQGPVVREFVDEAGTPIFYLSGENNGHRACACITFADRRRFRFLIRGKQQNAIMTAVDEAGNKIARYRHASDDIFRYSSWDDIAISVHPDQDLTTELVVAITVSTQWLDSYFNFQRTADSATL
jgi:DivIVA domain-containing protein